MGIGGIKSSLLPAGARLHLEVQFGTKLVMIIEMEQNFVMSIEMKIIKAWGELSPVTS